MRRRWGRNGGAARRVRLGAGLLAMAGATVTGMGTPRAQDAPGWPGAAPFDPPAYNAAIATRPLDAVLIERLCDKTLRVNEEDRLLGEIGLAVRSTIKYQGGVFSPDLIDDAVQEASEAITERCPEIVATDDAHRLGMIVGIAQQATAKLMANDSRKYSRRQIDNATAADLSQELTTPEIDAWLERLPPRQRALALFLYASDVTPQDVSQAVGIPPQSLATGSAASKASLLNFFRQDPPSAPETAAPMQLRQVATAQQPLAALLQPGWPSPFPSQEAALPGATSQVRITGISTDLYSGWSLLASLSGMPPDQSLRIDQPLLLEPDDPKLRRMIVTDAVEITDPSESPRRFLLRAYAIDSDRVGAGLRDTFHLAASTIDNPQARATLANRSLSSIEIARCLWHDYGADDPGLCR